MATTNTDHLHKLAKAMCSVDLAESQWTQELPRLPVPDLWLTISRYLASLKAVLAPCEQLADMHEQIGCKLSRAQVETNWRQFEHTDQVAKQFMLNEGPELQRDLKEYANRCQNWATDYWLQDMYLCNAAPLPVNSNPFFLFPRQHFASSYEMLMFATRIIQFSVDFKFRIDQQALKQDFGSGHGKGKALCMETYKNFFHSYRMPHQDMDRLLPQSRRSNHIVVASCNQFYILRLGQDPLDNPYRRDAGSQLNETSISEQLLRIYRVSREHARREQTRAGRAQNGHDDEDRAGLSRARVRIPKVGLLTSENRKQWARVHKRLSHCCASELEAGANPPELSEPTAGDDLRTRPRPSSGSNSPTTNTESLRLIEDCLFVMCLDSLVTEHPTPPPPPQQQQVSGARGSNCDADDDHARQVLAATRILTGGGSHLFSANRWFDKFLQIIVGRDGICGINIEHSASEGITVLRFLEEFLDFIRANPVAGSARRLSLTAPCRATSRLEDVSETRPLETRVGVFEFNESTDDAANSLAQQQNGDGGGGGGGGGSSQNSSSSSASMTSPTYVEPKSPSALLEESDKITPLSWSLDADLWRALDEAAERTDALNDNFSLVIKQFDQFGRKFIKSQSLSPDAFVQLALQYTFYKLHGCLVSTYESASLRQFRLGRVDNIRANTCEAYAWIQQMLACKQRAANEASGGGDSVNFKGAEAAFIKAMTKQVEILRYTISGGAPDNHLLALRQLARLRYGAAPEDEPELFREPSYGEFLNFRLSTSQLPNESGITVGYGAVVPDGYGCSYNPCEERMIFCIASFRSCPETSSSQFGATLEESLLEMRQLCLGRARSPPTKH